MTSNATLGLAVSSHIVRAGSRDTLLLDIYSQGEVQHNRFYLQDIHNGFLFLLLERSLRIASGLIANYERDL